MTKKLRADAAMAICVVCSKPIDLGRQCYAGVDPATNERLHVHHEACCGEIEAFEALRDLVVGSRYDCDDD